MRLHGPIGGAGRTSDFVELAKRLRESKRVAAVVLDIDSPGGSAAASDYMFLALDRLAQKKPLIASVTGTGASGAYLAAMAARRIVAAPTSIVGSIGVINVAPRVPRLLDRLGVEVSEHTSGGLKGAGAPWRVESEAEAKKDQQLVNDIYEAFIDRVATGRKMSHNRVKELATGEVWLGTQARDLGLVDEIGDIERAVELAADMAGVPAKAAPVSLRRPFVARLVERFATTIARSLADELEVRLSDRVRM